MKKFLGLKPIVWIMIIVGVLLLVCLNKGVVGYDDTGCPPLEEACASALNNCINGCPSGDQVCKDDCQGKYADCTAACVDSRGGKSANCKPLKDACRASGAECITACLMHSAMPSDSAQIFSG